MLRPFKFRAWEKSLKYEDAGTMWNPESIYKDYIITFDGEVLEEYESSFGGSRYDDYRNVSERFILMQFTGIKDKNGKEIYEGDIIIESHAEIDPNDGMSWEEKYTFAVEYVECRFNIYGMVRRPASEPELEVIGNIYENPELLK